MTKIHLTDKTLYYDTLDTCSFTLPMSLDTLARSVNSWDQSRVILFAKYGYKIPSNICGVLKALPDQGVFKCGT